MTNDDQQPRSIETVRNNFEHWRRTREKLTAIPEHLWASAIELSERHSICEIARNLRLNASDLKKRIARSQTDPGPEEEFQSNFIRLDIDRIETTEYVIQVSHRNGTSMKVYIKNSPPDFSLLSNFFRECVK